MALTYHIIIAFYVVKQSRGHNGKGIRTNPSFIFLEIIEMSFARDGWSAMVQL